MFDFHFISGFPRSGTTLLAAILRQNPDFYSHIESPTGRLFVDVIGTLGYNSEAGIMVGDEQRIALQEAIMRGYYAPLSLPENCTIFDNNRKWCANISAVGQVFPGAKVFAMVRPIAEVVDSMERLFHQNPLYASAMALGRRNLTTYDRINLILNAQEGVVGWSYNAVRSAYYGLERGRLIIIEYADLARYPGDVFKMIHEKTGKPPFDYDFKHVKQIPGVEEFDRKIASPGMHLVQPEVKYVPLASAMPPDIMKHLYSTYQTFWRKK